MNDPKQMITLKNSIIWDDTEEGRGYFITDLEGYEIESFHRWPEDDWISISDEVDLNVYIIEGKKQATEYRVKNGLTLVR